MQVMLVRKRVGVVGETQRTCHLVPVPDDYLPALTAYCGERIHRGEAELLAQPAGMPCVGCLFQVPEPNHEWA